MAMQFSNGLNGSRSDNKTARLALVAGLHVALGVFFIHGINSKKISLSILPEQVLVMLHPDPIEPVPPPEPPKPVPTLAPPDVVVPKVEVDVAPPALPPQIQATTTASDPAPVPTTVAATVPEAMPLPPAHDAGKMTTAVLADAKACALPDYPAHAARNGETGTTMLALLVGTDGRVTSARVEHTSGSRELDRAAVNALSLCRFKPATENGVAQAAWAQLAYVWTLDQ
jgi:protein TonB